jgi:hypothetical protein
MASVSPVLPDPTASPLPLRETLRVWGLHLLCFVLPGTTFAFVVSGPHEKALGAFLDAVVAQGTSEGDLDATVERFAAAFTALRASEPSSPPAPARAWGSRGVPFHQVLAACQRSPELRRRFVSILKEAIRRVTRAAERQGREHPEALATLLVLTALGVRSALDLDLRFDETGVRDAALRLLRATERSGS